MMLGLWFVFMIYEKDIYFYNDNDKDEKHNDNDTDDDSFVLW